MSFISVFVFEQLFKLNKSWKSIRGSVHTGLIVKSNQNLHFNNTIMNAGELNTILQKIKWKNGEKKIYSLMSIELQFNVNILDYSCMCIISFES